ncbi:hypothetical protein NKI96_04260 [Mesorhizobium sp. M0292]|uniref:hypothetical protein n=1 Tax=Mesorhizobium sp. M0292 TaxID=2956929 RepID=UPI00333B5C1B
MAYDEFEIDRIKHALGDMCIAWAHLEEGCFMVLFYTMRDIEYTAYELIRNELDLRGALQVCKGHAVANRWERHSDHIPILVDLIDGEIRAARNRFIHDPITSGVTSYIRQSYVTRYPKSPHKLDVHIGTHTEVSSEEIYTFTRAVRALERYAGSIVQYLDWLDGERQFDWEFPSMELAQLGAHFAITEYTQIAKSRGSVR